MEKKKKIKKHFDKSSKKSINQQKTAKNHSLGERNWQQDNI